MAIKSKSRQKKFDTRIDFTPMVDMNMLLITFFMLCTTMIKSQTLMIALPSNEKVDQENMNKAKESEAITIIIDGEVDDKGLSVPEKGKLYYYEGKPQVTVDGSNMKQVEFGSSSEGSIRKILQERNKEVLLQINDLKKEWKAHKWSKDDKVNDSIYQLEAKKIRNNESLTRPVVIIKATDQASYAHVVNVLDEMQINSISRYQIDRMNQSDSAMVIQMKGKALSNK